MGDVFDFQQRLRIPRADVPSAVALGMALLQVPPINRTGAMTKARQRLREAVKALQEAWAARERARGDRPDPRMADRRLDVAWRAVHEILQAQASLPADSSPRFEQADRLIRKLFHGGRKFTKLPYPSEWAQSTKLLDRIQDEGLAADLERVVGKDVMDELKAAHEEYGKAVSGMLHEEDDVNLREPLFALLREVTTYSIQVLATIDPDDPATEKKAIEALRPIEVLRDKLNAGRGTSEESTNEDLPLVTPDTTIPDDDTPTE